MATYSTTDFRKNLKIAYNDEPWVILEAQHVKPGKGVAFVKTRMRNLITGRVLEKNFRSGDSVEDPEVTDREMQYLYTDRKSTRLNSSHVAISYAVFCLNKK